VQIIDKNTIKDQQNEEWPLDRELDERDIGKLLYTIRDGNHRTFGALIGGETRVWINLYDNTFQYVKEWRAMKGGVKAKTKHFMEKERWPKSYIDLVRVLDRKLKAD
jgi:hypothetical protein